MTSETILSLITAEPQTVAQIAAQAGIKPQLCAGYLRTLHRAGQVRLGTMKKGHAKDINTYRLAEPVKHQPQQREEWRGGPLPLRYQPRESSYYSFYSRGVAHPPADAQKPGLNHDRRSKDATI